MGIVLGGLWSRPEWALPGFRDTVHSSTREAGSASCCVCGRGEREGVGQHQESVPRGMIATPSESLL